MLDGSSKAMFLKKCNSIENIYLQSCLNSMGIITENSNIGYNIITKLTEFAVALNSGNMSADAFTCMVSTFFLIYSFVFHIFT